MSYIQYLHELQVNGQNVDETDDFNTVGEEEETNDGAATAAPEDTAADAATEDQNAEATPDTAPVATEEPTANNTDNDGTDEEDDFTLEDDEEDTLDNTEEAPANDNDAQPAEDNEADDDFTLDGNDDAGENPDANEEGNEPAENNQPEAAGKELPKDPTDAIDDDDKRAAEEAIYDTLTDDQKRIRVLQLKIDYKDLYETLISTISNINNIPKNMDNLDTIKRLIMFLTKAKTILIDYIENNFNTNSYLENYTTYIKYLAIFRTATKVIEELNIAAGIKPTKEEK